MIGHAYLPGQVGYLRVLSFGRYAEGGRERPTLRHSRGSTCSTNSSPPRPEPE
ncbi:hypothetical protein [Microtetraspora niveoalba]|uniref:hypothetical protein n=1 Tax=Microtetraspora niveoalba TaxID=46175 RepID=UPI000B050C64|nr:hypothetical protein [Microtetraspora niveoalba]